MPFSDALIDNGATSMKSTKVSVTERSPIADKENSRSETRLILFCLSCIFCGSLSFISLLIKTITENDATLLLFYIVGNRLMIT